MSVHPVSYGDDISVVDSLSQLTLRGTDFVTQTQFGDTSPLPATGTMSLSGTNATASVDYDYSDTGLALSDLQFALSPGAFAEAATTYRIIPSVDLDFTVTGSLHWSGGFGSPTLFVQIQDITGGEPGPNVTNQFSSKSGTSNATVSVVNSVSNPLTGVLLAGDTYKLSFDLATDTNVPNNTSGNSTGGATITWTAVPEPSTIILAALGGLALLACRRRHA
jgi:hypothetical protein